MKRKYKGLGVCGAFCSLCFLFPLFIGLLGMYLNNIYLMIGGLVLFSIVGALVIKFGTKYIENKKKYKPCAT